MVLLSMLQEKPAEARKLTAEAYDLVGDYSRGPFFDCESPTRRDNSSAM